MKSFKVKVAKLNAPITYKTLAGVDHLSPEKTPHADMYLEDKLLFIESMSDVIVSQDWRFCVLDTSEALVTTSKGVNKKPI